MTGPDLPSLAHSPKGPTVADEHCDVCGAPATVSDGIVGMELCDSEACLNTAWEQAFPDERGQAEPLGLRVDTYRRRYAVGVRAMTAPGPDLTPEALTGILGKHVAEWRGETTTGRVWQGCTCGRWRGWDKDFPRHLTDVLTTELPRLLTDADRQGAARVTAAVEAVHGEAGPEGSSWCAADNKDWPCPTIQALAQAATPPEAG
jgi:hypothetical protein